MWAVLSSPEKQYNANFNEWVANDTVSPPQDGVGCMGPCLGC